MLERAAWRRGLTDPRTPLGTHLGRDAWLGLPVVFWVALYACAWGLALPFFKGDLGRLLFLCGFMPLFGSRKDYHAPSAPSPRQGLRKPPPLRIKDSLSLLTVDRIDEVVALAPFPTPDAPFGVEITLRRGERVTGGDLGVVVFSEGWLVYEGRSTAFSLSPGDVRKAWPGTTAWTLYLPEGQGLTLLSHDPGWKAAIEAWLAAPRPSGLSRLPPLVPNAVRRLRMPGYLHLGGAVLVGLALTRLVSNADFARVAPVGVLALLLFALGTFLAWRRR